ncbi:T9SS sorting signal type C domain-containing protein [Formosa maritima]|uniref:T9SS type A sorting domain-containing protein n=1 Tax=Formosa maritima TaxID=2592046 RepID=A0A5D0GKZ8_9FLAO|nr:T9SS sorting signal type C domain-containing protein [Formosa maritima]TYA59705.1 T9SS type A sorting domain-containing protein [Formosa maritima]
MLFIKVWMLLIFGLTYTSSFSQTILLDPLGDGGFDDSNDFAEMNWEVTSSTNPNRNQWVSNRGAIRGFTSRNCAYITDNTALAIPPHRYTENPARATHLFRTITVPAFETEISVDFIWAAQGQNIKDLMRIWIVPTTYTPVYGIEITPAVDRIRLGSDYSESGTWTASPTLTIPSSYAGTTFKFVIEWVNDDATVNDPPAAIDDISIISDLPPPPTNNDPCNAININSNLNCNYSTYTTIGARPTTTVPNPGCGNYLGGDVWFRTTVPAIGGIIVDTQIGNLTDGAMAIYRGSCNGLTLIACDDNSSNNGSMPQIVQTNLTPGETIYIRFWENGNNAFGSFGICVTPTPPPPNNDECSSAINLTVNPSLTCNNVTFGSTAFATPSSQPDNVVGNPDNDVWFSFVATNINHQISLLNVIPVVGSNTNLGIGVYNSPSTNCSTLNLITSINAEVLTLNGLNVGNTYYVRVYGFDPSPNSAQVNFNICVNTIPDPPTNDLCANAILIPVLPICNYETYTNAGATTSGIASPNCGDYAGGDVWFYAIADETGEITIDTQNLDMNDGAMAVYSGTDCNNLTLLDCDSNNSANGLMPSITVLGLSEGDVIYIRFWEEGNNNNGTFGICATSPITSETVSAHLECPGDPSESIFATFSCSGTTSLGNTLNGILRTSDPVARRPVIRIISTDPCEFDLSDTSNYSSINFTVTLTGRYIFNMSNPSPYFDAMGYIIVNDGNFVPGSCGSGTYIAGDDDSGSSLNPQITAILTEGVPYTLITTKFAFGNTSHVGRYRWNVLGPSGEVEWYSNETGGTPIATGATLNPVGLSGSNLPDTSTPGNYIFWVNCPGSTAPRIKAEFTIGKIWEGAVDSNWNNPNNWKPLGKPRSTDCVYIGSALYQPKLTLPGPPTPPTPGYAKNLSIGENATLELESGTAMTVTDWIDIDNTASCLIRNNANLIQVTDVASNNNTGKINMQRSVASVTNLDYIYWSSPVEVFNVTNISPGSNPYLIYKWIPTVSGNGIGNYGEWQFTNETMQIGKGYIIRGLSGTTPTPPVSLTTTEFTGTPNNGIINVPIQRGMYSGVNYPGAGSTMATALDDNWNLIGNPYPSSISAREFITVNASDIIDDASASIAGTIYLWRHLSAPSNTVGDPFYGDFGYNYNPNDYIKYNHTGSAPAGFSGYIAAGQSFFVLMDHNTSSSSESVIFNNTMRNETYRNDQFYKTVEDVEHHRIWLDLIDSNNLATSILVGYVEGATNEQDRLFDGHDLSDTNTRFYSLISEEKMAIQGKELPFNENDTVSLGVEIPQYTTYTIAINSLDGLFETTTQDIYLEDTYNGITHDLRIAPYLFTSSVGVFDDRFILRYTNQTLNIEEFEANSSISISAPQNNYIKVTSGTEIIKSVKVYDVLGRVLYNNHNINKTELIITNVSRSNGILFVKATLINGKQKTQKIVLRK